VLRDGGVMEAAICRPCGTADQFERNRDFLALPQRSILDFSSSK